MSRVIGVFSDQSQASACMSDLTDAGFDRKDMNVSSFSALAKDETTLEMNALQGAQNGVIVSVEVPMYRRGAVAEMMRQHKVADLRLN